ncbi:MAG: phosphoribosylamine--glycine ligase [Candidatus Melainabacteria bacterium RIFOXYA12_FULL_32_12]|nr:MAG: phosphoribosylamine--glycine ligase [Candidatus Melainabacteria bacterium GWF2_32_7]OGI21129.1 MAG: phosphoribosylamine--glycine ligase [Candidatus Melainabacteria bacterium RIFOXYA2_FULL_32_9]OGI31113.1 MAG: phosphoribosylamine--glycine ligase [Candidatus Melainabacteria bacterium RIFOXYA12_FULL_32_12]
MKVLVVGSGGREHTLVWKLKQSKKVSQIFCAPGNAGIRKLAQCVDIRVDDINGLCQFAKDNNIDLTVVGPELPLSLGIVDTFKKNSLLIYGPTQAAARIESSKSYAKKLMHKYKVPTAAFAVFDKETQAIDHARKSKYPLVVKYDGLASGKGVFICETFEQARKVIEGCFENLYKAVVIEEFLVGREVSFQVITDGYNAIPLSPAQDFKKAYDGNTGSNTGGMGAYAPVDFVDTKLEQKIAEKVIFPIIDGLNNEGTPFAGTLYAGLMVDEKNDPYVIEFNARFGDPETQVILPLLEDDLFQILYSAATGALSDDYETFNISDSHAITVVIASGGYPGNFKKGYPIEGLENIDDDDLIVFHSGTTMNQYGEVVTNGGRVLTVTATASTLHRAYDRVYESIDLIKFKDMRYRKDIAKSQVKDKDFFVNKT